MVAVTHITPRFAVAAALQPSDFAELAAAGYRSILSNRPDGEAGAELTARDESIHAWRAGLMFRHVAADKLELFTDPIVEGMDQALRELPGPVVAHCASGIRSAIVWAATSARQQPVDCVLKALDTAGFDLDFIRDDLEAQADRRRWLVQSPLLDCKGEVVQVPLSKFESDTPASPPIAA